MGKENDWAGTALSVITHSGPTARKSFDTAMSAELQDVLQATDAALGALMGFSSRVLSLSLKPEQVEQQAAAFGLIYKAINDIFGTVEIMRAGYADLSLGCLRTVVEGFAAGVLVSIDDQIFRNYKNDQYSTSKAFDQFAQRSEVEIDVAMKQTLRDFHKMLNAFAHPSALALSLHSLPKGQEVTVGGYFDSGKIELYRQTLRCLTLFTKQISGFLSVRGSTSATMDARLANDNTR